ncbi:MAG: sodium:proton antiporter [Verrucomicrobiota bacterium]
MAADEQVSHYRSSRRLFILIISNVGGCLAPVGDPPYSSAICGAFRSGGSPPGAGRCGRLPSVSYSWSFWCSIGATTFVLRKPSGAP